MKVIGFTTALPLAGNMAGGTVFFHEVAKRFVELGHEVIIITQPRKKKLVQDLVIDNVRYVRDEKYDDADVILLHSAALEANPPLSQFKQPILYIVHSWSDLIEKDLKALTMKDYLISNSVNMLEQVSKYRTNHKVIYPICNSIYTKPLAHSNKYITTIGSSVVKNLGLFYTLALKYPNQKFLHIKGGYGTDKHNRPVNVRFAPNSQDLRPYYKDTRILLVPSFTETYSLVAREAGLLGIPVVCSNLSGLRENLGDTGLYANPHNIESFEKHIDRLKSPTYYNKVSRNIKAHCQKEELLNRAKLDALIKSL